MSRCFPYPPPGYVRNPVAVAEVKTTTKLQKEKEKAERKKEKRNEKKALQQVGGEISKHSKRSHKKRKHEDLIAGQESREASKESVEQLEKSGLTEEHGAPFSTQAAHGSPESSQDSSKRRKVVLPSPSQNKNGSILRIRIRRDQDSPAAMLDNSRVLEQPTVPQMGSGSSLIKQNSIQPHNIKGIAESAAALQQSIKRDSQAVLKQVSVQPLLEVSQRIHLPTTAKVMQKMEPRLSVNPAMRRLDPPSAKGSADPSPAKLTRRVDHPPEKPSQRDDLPPTKVLQRADLPPTKVLQRADLPPTKVLQRADLPPTKVLQRADLPPPKVVQRVDHPPSSKLLRRDAPPSTVKVLQKEASGIAFCQAGVQQPPLLQKSSVPVETPLIKQQQQQANSLPKKEEPCFSGRNTEAAAVPEVKQSKSDQKKHRKTEKKEKKFGDLFVTWNPPSFEIEDTVDLGAQDWLLGGARNPDASMVACTANDGLAPFQGIGQQFLLQPRAIHLPDLHVYQLPYVVPF